MLKLPSDYVLDSDCIELLFTHLKEHIIYYYKDNKLYDMGIDIYLHDMCFKIKYNKHYYWIAIAKINNIFHYYLRPYKKEHLTMIATSPNIFDKIIEAIIEHDKITYNKSVK